MDHLGYLCLVFVVLSRLFIAALCSPAGRGLISWLLFVMFERGSLVDCLTRDRWSQVRASPASLRYGP